MKIKRYLRTLSLCLFITVATFGCDMNYDKKDSRVSGPVLGMGLGCMMTSPITMKSTTYDMDNNITSASMQVINNMTVQSSQPNMTSMYEMYAGVELEVDWTSSSIIKQTPLLTQFWALNKMASSTNAGKNGTWMDSDDIIDPLLGFFETTQVDDKYQQIKYSGFGINPSGRVDYIVKNNKKIKTYEYKTGDDDEFGTDDDELEKTTLYKYDSAGKMIQAINYSGDEETFKGVYVFTYDTNGRFLEMNSYRDQDISKNLKLYNGSYSTLEWGNNDGKTSLKITLGYWYAVKIPLIKFYYEFNNNGTIHKMIQYKPIIGTIDTCYVYVYTPGTMLNIGEMNDESINYSDDEETQKSHTVNELVFSRN